MYEKVTLAGGVRIVFERIPYVRSASIGIWVGSGSRLESAAENGASHFIEHMLFKGTSTRSAPELAHLMDGIGGQINAFTTKECTCFYGRVLDSNLRTAMDILFDMFFSSKFSDEDIVSERGVIYEEIDMYEDTPDDLVTERLIEEVYLGTPLSLPILGSRESLSQMNGDFLREFMGRHYLPSRIVIAISGSFADSDIDYIKSTFSGLTGSDDGETSSPAVYSQAFTVKDKPIEQNHLCLAFPGLPIASPDRYTMQLLSNILGGGMSSRLFQTVREKRGLCYSIYSFGSAYRDTGIFGIYAALNRDMESGALGLIMEVVREFLDAGVTEAELGRAREQVKSNVLMSLESTGARMNTIGKNELYRGEIPTTEDIIAAYDAVTADGILSLARKHIDYGQISFSAVGRVSEAEEYRELFNIAPFKNLTGV